MAHLACKNDGSPQASLSSGRSTPYPSSAVLYINLQVPAFRLFPGQVVAVTGINPSGACLLATAVRESAPLPPASSPLPQLASYVSATGAPLKKGS